MLAALIVASPAGTRAQRYQTQQVAAQQVPARLTAIQVPGPAPATAITKVCIETVGRMAYVEPATSANLHNSATNLLAVRWAAITTFSAANARAFDGSVLAGSPQHDLALDHNLAD